MDEELPVIIAFSNLVVDDILKIEELMQLPLPFPEAGRELILDMVSQLRGGEYRFSIPASHAGLHELLAAGLVIEVEPMEYRLLVPPLRDIVRRIEELALECGYGRAQVYRAAGETLLN